MLNVSKLKEYIIRTSGLLNSGSFFIDFIKTFPITRLKWLLKDSASKRLNSDLNLSSRLII